MRFAVLYLAFCALVHAGDGDDAPSSVSVVVTTGKAGKNAKGKNVKAKNAKAPKAAAATSTAASGQVSDRMLPVSMSVAAVSPVASPMSVSFRPACPFNNCQSCTNQLGCYWTGGGCSNMPCSIYAPCAFAPAQCGGCQSDSQCGGAPRRCENGQCVGVEGDKACDYYLDCGGCLSRPNCLWDPNTLTGSCKPKEQCDFTFRSAQLSFPGATPTPAPPPATACVKNLEQCTRPNLNGAVLDLNTNRGIGCTNHGQCNPDQYCYSCSKCVGTCSRCKSPGVPVSGMCGPAWRCPIDNDSISQTCPIIRTPVILPPVIISPVVIPPVVRPPANSCNYQGCSACTGAYGCVWSGSTCYFTTVPCTQLGCANTPQDCPRLSVSTSSLTAPATNCAFNNCQNCAAAQGCAWSGQFCYYALAPCTNVGCANSPAQCGGCTRDEQCDIGRRCEKGACLASPGDRNCDYYVDCVGCLSNPNCLWDPNSFTHCKPQAQCDFTFRSAALSFGGVAPPPTPVPATACVKTVDKCSLTNFNGAVLTANEDRGAGCTNHGQCQTGQYCVSCSKCRGDCTLCNRGGAPVSGICAPSSRCPINLDSINDLCPVR